MTNFSCLGVITEDNEGNLFFLLEEAKIEVWTDIWVKLVSSEFIFSFNTVSKFHY